MDIIRRNFFRVSSIIYLCITRIYCIQCKKYLFTGYTLSDDFLDHTRVTEIAIAALSLSSTEQVYYGLGMFEREIEFAEDMTCVLKLHSWQYFFFFFFGSVFIRLLCYNNVCGLCVICSFFKLLK